MNENKNKFKNRNELTPQNSGEARGNTTASASNQRLHNDISTTSELFELKSQFEELQRMYSELLPKVDPSLLNDLLLRQMENPSNAPMYMVEVFLESGVDSQQVRDTVLKETGMVPAIYDSGTHIATHNRLTLEMLKRISEKEEVIEITGEYNGDFGNWAPSHEHRTNKNDETKFDGRFYLA